MVWDCYWANVVNFFTFICPRHGNSRLLSFHIFILFWIPAIVASVIKRLWCNEIQVIHVLFISICECLIYMFFISNYRTGGIWMDVLLNVFILDKKMN